MRSGFALLLMLGLDAQAAIAQEGCDAWFPDFSCERSGRFAG